MNSRYTYLQKKLVYNDIFGYGKNESEELDIISTGNPNDYPNVVLLSTVNNYLSLYEESKHHVEIIGKKYFSTYCNDLPDGLEQIDIKDTAIDIGFEKNTYQAYGLRDPKNNKILSYLKPETRDFFEKFPAKTFRQALYVAEPMWKCKYHIDHENYLQHGFRVIVPIYNNFYIVIQEDGHNLLYQLVPGGVYFVNVAKMHRAFNPYKTKRYNFLFQMNSDRLIFTGGVEKSIPWPKHFEKFKNFNVNSNIMIPL